MPRFPRFESALVWAFIAAVLAAPVGCELLEPWGAFRLDEPEPETPADSRGAMRPVRDAVRLEIVFVERPTGDPLLGETLWRELDEVGAGDAAVRKALEENGFRVGHCGASPPRPLQTLLGMTAQLVESGPDAKTKALVGRRVSLPTNDDYEIQAGMVLPLFEASVVERGESTPHSFEMGRGVFRARAERLQDGWVRLEFTPEIHHGQNQLRRVPTEGGFKLLQSQNVQPLWGLRFDLNLGEQEMVVIGADSRAITSLANRFFAGGHDGSLQRLLVVRVVDVQRGETVAAE